jgi:hypothetical protein
MNTNNFQKSDPGFRKLSHEELIETYGGFYKGPVSPYTWLKFLIDTIRNRED